MMGEAGVRVRRRKKKKVGGHVVQPNVYVTETTVPRQAIKGNRLNTSGQILRFANGEQRERMKT